MKYTYLSVLFAAVCMCGCAASSSSSKESKGGISVRLEAPVVTDQEFDALPAPAIEYSKESPYATQLQTQGIVKPKAKMGAAQAK
jgi:hypothetical protein